MAREYSLHRPKADAPSGIDYRASLNEEQYRAVSSPPGRALVIAGAGSGKTRTLTYRVAWLLDHGVQARQILLLTFTNKAAREMIERVRDLVPHDTHDLWAGTFHSIGSRILRRNAEEIGFTRSFSILDRDDQKSMLNAVVKGMEIDTTGRRFPKTDVISAIISLAENTSRSVQSVIAESYPHLDEWMSELASLHSAYVERKRAANSMDFDDLLVLTVRLFEDRPDILEIYQRKFLHILVDEYQDTNAVQERMISLLAGSNAGLMAVGDDAQSIYSWRGADVDHLLDFPQRNPDSRLYTIETNYRSVPEILELSNAAIRANRERFEKNLRPARDSQDFLPALIAVPDPGTQAFFVGQRIQELIDGEVPPEEIAVLYRAHFHSMEIQMELTRRGIPFAITSGLRFFEQAHVKDVSAFLRIVTNRRDEVSFLRIAHLLPGCGPAGAARLWQQWLAAGLADLETPPACWSDILLPFKVPKKSQKYWEQLCHTLDELSPDGSFAPPHEMIFSVLEGVYAEYLESAFENPESRRADIEQLGAFSRDFDDVSLFLEQLSLLGSVDGDPKPASARETAKTPQVTLSSVHQAKGLEWQAVFLVWLADGHFPNNRVLESEDLRAFEEERRLFYVGLTRAKDQLYLCYPMFNPKSYSGDAYCRPSRFFDDFPSHLVEEWDITGSARDEWNQDDSPF